MQSELPGTPEELPPILDSTSRVESKSLSPQSSTPTSESQLFQPPFWTHWLLLGISVAVLVASFVMKSEGETAVFLPGTDRPLPDICVTKSRLGMECPGCGLTRSFISISHGNWGKAFQFNAAGFVVYFLVAMQVPWQSFQIIRGFRNQTRLFMPYAWPLLFTMIGCLLIQWIVRIIMGLTIS